MLKSRGPKRRLDHAAIVEYAITNPTLFQSDIAKYFDTAQSRISHILKVANIQTIHRGRPLKQKTNQTDEQFEWEKILHDAGLGMDRGLRINKKRILYGFDPAKEIRTDSSITNT